MSRVKTPTVLQMEAVECGAAALSTILAHHGRHVPLERLRTECGVSRDGANAKNILEAARRQGLEAEGFSAEPKDLHDLPMPAIAHWNFNHFVVVEGFGKNKVYLNDPATGPRTVATEEFDLSFTGVVLTFQPGPKFEKVAGRWKASAALVRRVRGSEMALVFLVLVGLGLVLPGLVAPTFARIFVDDILVGRKHDWAQPLWIAIGLTIAIQGGLTFLQRKYLLRLETKLSLAKASQFIWHVLRLPLSFFVQRNPGEISSRVPINDRVAEILSGPLASTLLACLMIAFYALLMLRYDLVLTAIGLSLAGLNVLALQYFSSVRTNASRRMVQELSRFVGFSISSLRMIETIKASALESDCFTRWSGYQAQVTNANQRAHRSSELLALVPAVLTSIGAVAILWIGGLRVIDARLSIGMLVAFQTLMAGLLGPVGELLKLGATVQEVEGDMLRLDDVLAHPLDPELDKEGVPLPATSSAIAGALELVDLQFGYSPIEGPLIDSFSLSLKPGRRIALVGASGSGKSTIAKLVVGLYAPWAGAVLIDGKPRQAHPRTWLNGAIAFIDQDITLFEGSVHDNISLWDRSIPESRVVAAAKDACIHEEIVSRPGGYHSHVEEGGRNFSGGQRQRLEIARALVQNPSILVLDEATSALDPATEQRIDESLRRRGCTCLIVAHRLSTIRDADEIVVLERGKVVERGTEETLRRQGGAYCRLIEIE